MTYENLDRKLLNELLGDGRASLRNLSEELDVSVTTVSNHLEGLEAEGIVTGYTPVVEYDALGYDVTAVVQLKVEGSAIQELTDRLQEQKQMLTVYETTGDYDIVAIGKFKNTDGMNEQIKALLADVDINESNTSVVLNSVKDHKQFELDTDAN
ncbi:MAG: transcriptional regulator [Halonotius sp. J07HN4]|nr:MAG: transcriptional regulator [Halonotius sp. J07HN4]